MKLLDKYGWPVVFIKGKTITNIIRAIIHTNAKVTFHTSPAEKGPVLDFKTRRPVIFTSPGGTIDGPSTIYASIDQMKTYLIEEARWAFGREDIVFEAEPSCDERVGWKDKRKVYVKRIGGEVCQYPHVWGYCATKFPKHLGAYRDGFRAAQRIHDPLYASLKKDHESLITAYLKVCRKLDRAKEDI